MMGIGKGVVREVEKERNRDATCFSTRRMRKTRIAKMNETKRMIVAK